MDGGSGEIFNLEERLSELSRKGDNRERLAAVVDFEMFHDELNHAVPRSNRKHGGR